MTAYTVENDKDKDTEPKTENWKAFSAASNPGCVWDTRPFPCPDVKICSVHCQLGIYGRSKVFFESACKSHVLGINNWY